MVTKHICVACGGPATKSVALTNYDPENMFEGYVVWYCDEHYSDPTPSFARNGTDLTGCMSIN